MERLDFSSIIRKDREEHKSKKFEGTFLEYLEIVKENPEITMLAHQRMYKLITEPGVMRRSLRLQGKKNFSRVYKEGSVVRSDYVVVYFLPASEQKWQLW